VVLVDGALVLYVERGGKTVLTFGADEDALRAAAVSLTTTVRERLGRMRVERIDGEFSVGSPLGLLLAEAGFSATPGGLRLRG
jgi:ATP-dependent Lhr-like helicase